MKTIILAFSILGIAFAFNARGAEPPRAGAHDLGHRASPYSGQQSREIKALSEDEVAALLSGAGMGFAKAAELNRHPGPMHALEHAQALGLSQAQRAALASLMTSHKEEARALGAQVVRHERDLDRLFAEGRAKPESVDATLLMIAEAGARLRGAHLKTHLETAKLLTPAQIDRYVELRGYATTGSAEAHRHSGSP